MAKERNIPSIKTHIDTSKAGDLPWAIEMMLVRKIKKANRNPRTHPQKQIEEIMESYRRFGVMNPSIVDSKNRLVAGHARLEAAIRLGLTRIPVIRVSHLSKPALRAYALADNKIPEHAGWDRSLLAIEIEELSPELSEIGLDIGITGFQPFEIDALLGELGSDPQDPADEVVEVSPGPTVARTGDCFVLGDHRIVVGDARERENFARLLAKAKAQMAILDGPYNLKIQGYVGGRGAIKHREFLCASGEMSSPQYTHFLKQIFVLCSDYSVDGSIHFVFGDWRHIDEISAAGKAAYDELKNLCVWAKTTPGQGTFYRSQHELVFVFKRGTASHLNNFQLGQHGRTRSNVWHYPGVNTFRAGRMDELRMHPTVKPVALVTDAMRDCSRRGDIVLDAFVGSGTTIIAAEQIGRRAFCMDVDPAYVDVAVERWQRFTRRDAILEATGQTFEELKAQRERRS